MLLSSSLSPSRIVSSLAVAVLLTTSFACSSTADDNGEGAGESSSAITGGRRGIDYSYARPSGAAIRADGYTFAARYLSYEPGKNLTRGEADGLRSQGIDVVVVWEAGAYDALDGYGVGVQDAQVAEQQAAAAGSPSDRPIYFAIDFDASAGQQGAIDAYFDGVASVIGRNRTGAYGGYYPIKRLFDAGKIRYGWQTFAWSGGLWDGRAQLRQVQNDVFVGGGDCDVDVGVAPDFGQWGYRGQLVEGNCTAEEKADAAKFGCDCADHRASGGACDGTGCSAQETADAAKFGCSCVDHRANGGFCPGTGCTYRETLDAAHFGCSCVDHKANGSFCPGTGCTARERLDAAKFGCGCIDHKASGGACPGTDCTAKETKDCAAKGMKCSAQKCVP